MRGPAASTGEEVQQTQEAGEAYESGSRPLRPTSPRRRRSRRPLRPRRIRALVVALALGLAAAGVIALMSPVEDAIREITLPLRHEDIIRQQARDKDLDPALIAAMIYRESKFRDQTSKAGAQGLMQILPDTARFVAHKTGGTSFDEADLGDPQINISYGSWYLRYLLDVYDGNRVAAIAAYNAGRRHVDRWGGTALKVEDIRFPETQEYVNDVLKKRDEYANRYRSELGL
jgi:soluble lytic murein transglycosylase